MPVIVKFDPTTNSQQADIIQDASPFNDGVMTKTQAAKLGNISQGGHFVLWTFGQTNAQDALNRIAALDETLNGGAPIP